MITHEYDAFLVRDGSTGRVGSPYLLYDVLGHLHAMGHSCVIARGTQTPPGDAALLHVDSTIVDEKYLQLRKKYPVTINFETADISKRRISRLILNKSDLWCGQVIVKSNYNNNALMEELHNKGAARVGRPLPHPDIVKSSPYRVLDSLEMVDDEVWLDPSLVVERFVPERDKDGGFVLRTWVFMGAKERCTRMVTSHYISKAADVLRYESIEVPSQLRAERQRLNFDFGKFDFVMQDGEPILFDANRTPGVATSLMPLMKKGALNLAEGLAEIITR